MNRPSRLSEQMVTFVTDGNLAVHVTDLGKAEDFYSNVLRLKLSKRTDERPVYDTGKITLYIVKKEKVIPFIPALEVSNYEKAKAVSHEKWL